MCGMTRLMKLPLIWRLEVTEKPLFLPRMLAAMADMWMLNPAMEKASDLNEYEKFVEACSTNMVTKMYGRNMAARVMVEICNGTSPVKNKMTGMKAFMRTTSPERKYETEERYCMRCEKVNPLLKRKL